jgi:hypothetical protein
MIQNGTWSGADAGLTSKINQNGYNESKRVTFTVVQGATAIFQVLHGTGVDRVNTGTSFPVAFRQPQGRGRYPRSPGRRASSGHARFGLARLTPSRRTPAPKTPARFAFVMRTAAPTPAQPAQRLSRRRRDRPHWMGNGILFKHVQGCHARDVEVMGSATGVRIRGVDGSRVSTNLASGAATGATERRPGHHGRIDVATCCASARVPPSQPRFCHRHQRQDVSAGRLRLPGRPAADQLPAGVRLWRRTPAVTQFRPSSQARCTYNNENTRGLGNPPNGDVGGEADGAWPRHSATSPCGEHRWTTTTTNRLGSVDYNIDGTGTDPYCHEGEQLEMSCLERLPRQPRLDRVGHRQRPAQQRNTNGGMIVYRNYVWARSTTTDASPINPLHGAHGGCGCCCARRPDWVIRQNTFFITNGAGRR